MRGQGNAVGCAPPSPAAHEHLHRRASRSREARQPSPGQRLTPAAKQIGQPESSLPAHEHDPGRFKGDERSIAASPGDSSLREAAGRRRTDSGGNQRHPICSKNLDVNTASLTQLRTAPPEDRSRSRGMEAGGSPDRPRLAQKRGGDARIWSCMGGGATPGQQHRKQPGRRGTSKPTAPAAHATRRSSPPGSHLPRRGHRRDFAPSTAHHPCARRAGR